MNFLEKYGPAAIVTGASAGIGKAFAYDLASRGFHLVLTARRERRLADIKKDIEKKYSVEVLTLPLDLSLPNAADEIKKSVDRWGKDIGLLINNAGFGSSGPLFSLDEARESSMVALNCSAVVSLTMKYLPHFKSRGRGGIVIVSSVLGFLPRPTMATYCGTKGFDLLFGESLYGEMKPFGVDVVVVCPGLTDTEFHTAAESSDRNFPIKPRTPEQVVNTTWKAMGKRPTVVDGPLNKFVVVLARILPRKWIVELQLKRIKRASSFDTGRKNI